MNTLLTQLQSSRVNLEKNKNNRSKTNDTSHNPRDLAGLALGRLPLLPKILAVVRKSTRRNSQHTFRQPNTHRHRATHGRAPPCAPWPPAPGLALTCTDTAATRIAGCSLRPTFQTDGSVGSDSPRVTE